MNSCNPSLWLSVTFNSIRAICCWFHRYFIIMKIIFNKSCRNISNLNSLNEFEKWIWGYKNEDSGKVNFGWLSDTTAIHCKSLIVTLWFSPKRWSWDWVSLILFSPWYFDIYSFYGRWKSIEHLFALVYFNKVHASFVLVIWILYTNSYNCITK